MNRILPLVFAVVLSPAASAAPGDLTGTVIESMDSGGYTYILLKTSAGEKKWAAVNKADVKKGQTATVVGVMDMRNFESPTLKRKFDHIAFGALDAGAAAPHGAMKGRGMGGGMPAGMIHGGRAPDTGPIKVAKASGPDARTVAEVYARKSDLKGKEAVVSGKVVKYTPAVLDGNWAHLRDGSGSAKDGSDDLTVILKDEAKLGQTVTVRGRVVLDKDLGGMYKFAVILENAVLVK